VKPIAVTLPELVLVLLLKLLPVPLMGPVAFLPFLSLLVLLVVLMHLALLILILVAVL
jgi:hypothetical protein